MERVLIMNDQKQIAKAITHIYGRALGKNATATSIAEQLIQDVKNAAQRPAAEVEHIRYRPGIVVMIVEHFEKEIERLSKPVIQKSVYRVSGYICAGGGIIGQGDTPQKAYEDYNSKVLAIKKQIPYAIQSQNPTGATNYV